MNIFRRSIKYLLITLLFEKILKKDFSSTLQVFHYRIAPLLPLNILLSKRKIKKLKKDFNENLIIFYYLVKEFKRGTMLDVGAMNGGAFLPFMLHKYKIHTFEPDPDPKKRKILEEYAKRENVELYNLAVSDKDDQELNFYTNEESAGISSLAPFTSGHTVSAKVKTITLRKFLKENDIHRINYLKIDTEGFDLFVLKGFPWEDLHADIVLCEFENKKTLPLGYSFEDMGNYLLEQDYEVFFSEWYPIVKYGVKHKFKQFKKYPASLDDKDGWGNFIAFKKELSCFKNILSRFE